MRFEKPLGRFCFLNAPFNTEFLGYGGEPTSLLYALAVLVDEIRRGHFSTIHIEDISVISFRSAAEMDIAAFQRSIQSSPPRVFGVSSMTPSSENARRIAQGVKAVYPDVITIFGGPHEDEMAEPNARLGSEPLTKPTAITHPYLADFSVSGDGEYALSFLVGEIEMAGPNAHGQMVKERILAKRSEIEQLPGIGSISFMLAGVEQRIRLSGHPLNIDALPFMPRELLDDNHSRSFSIFRGSGRNLRTAQLMTSRGCFWTCAFCTEATGKTLQRSFEKVRQEIEQLRPLGYDAIFFDDSTFTNIVTARNPRGSEGASRRAFLSELLKYLGDTGWNWGCETRIDQVDKSVLYQLKQAGCSYIYFGVESVNDAILRDMHKGQRRNRVQNTLDAIEEVGLRIGLSLMFCAPDMKRNLTNESHETFEETISFFKERVARGNISIISTNIATYYPGSEMTHRAIAGGMKLDFLHPTPNTGYPWTRFEDGQGYHPPNVNKSFVEDIATLTARRLAPYLLKGNIAAVEDERLAESLYRKELINLNFPVELSGSVASKVEVSSDAEMHAEPNSRSDIFEEGRVLLGSLCGLKEEEARRSVVFTRTPDEAIAVGLAAAGYYAAPFRALVPDIDLTTIAAPFQFIADHGDVRGESVRSRVFQKLNIQYQARQRMISRRTKATVILLDHFTDEYELLHRIRRLLTDSNDVVLLPHIDPSTGRILDVRMLCAELREEKSGEDLLIIVDGRLAGGAIPGGWSVEDIACDYYVVSPLESLSLLGCCGLIVCARRRGRSMAHLQEWAPLDAGMLPAHYGVDSGVRESFPGILVKNILDNLDRITSPGDNRARLNEITRHRLEMKQQLTALLLERFPVDILSADDSRYVDGILSARFRDIDQFGLVEHLWREQQVLVSYFCASDLIRFAFDLSTTTPDLQEAVNRLSNIMPRFQTRDTARDMTHLLQHSEVQRLG
ncbi:MAG TPA: B12-binding domain-containing radical SAM protein [Pyrinomonadaceae bacterium]|nr:B12-binding domain-containing radical SAM protein [Pyrinomonadaceae bacterium]